MMEVRSADCCVFFVTLMSLSGVTLLMVTLLLLHLVGFLLYLRYCIFFNINYIQNAYCERSTSHRDYRRHWGRLSNFIASSCLALPNDSDRMLRLCCIAHDIPSGASVSRTCVFAMMFALRKEMVSRTTC
jgi:hypothetical protein